MVGGPSGSVVGGVTHDVLKLCSCSRGPSSVSIRGILHRDLRLITRFPAVVAATCRIGEETFCKGSVCLRPVGEKLSATRCVLERAEDSGLCSSSRTGLLSVVLVLRTSRNNNGGSAFTAEILASDNASACSTVTTNINSLGNPHRNNTGLGASTVVGRVVTGITSSASGSRIGSCLIGVLGGRTNSNLNLVCNVNRTMCAVSSPHTIVLGGDTERLTCHSNFRGRFGALRGVRRMAPRLLRRVGNSSGRVYTGISLCSNLYCGILNVPRSLCAPLFTDTEVTN